MRLIFLIMSTTQMPWRELENNCLTALNKRSLQKSEYSFVCRAEKTRKLIDIPIDLLFFRGLKKGTAKMIDLDYGARFASNNLIEVAVRDRWDTMFIKFVAAANLILETFDFDYLIRISPSTFVNVDLLRKNLKIGADYGGAVSKGKPFASGWASFFSTRALKTIIADASNELTLNQRMFDDELVGQIMMKNGIKCKSSPIASIDSQHEISRLRSSEFIRVKSPHNRVKVEREKFESIESALYGV